MNVYEQRSTIERRLRRALGSNFVIVNGPDHPLLLRPPDLLIGGEGRLMAIMLGTAEESKAPERAIERLALCRAALPTETVFVFAAAPERGNVAERMAGDVDETIRWDGLQELEAIASRHSRAGDRYSWKLKSRIMDRFSATFRAAQHLRNVATLKNDGREYFATSSETGKFRARFTERKFDRYSVGEFNGHPGPRLMAKLTLLGAQRSYSLDNGVPYPASASVSSAYVDSVPTAAGDPEKYLRASAFSGWVLVPYGSEYDADQINHYVDQRILNL